MDPHRCDSFLTFPFSISDSCQSLWRMSWRCFSSCTSNLGSQMIPQLCRTIVLIFPALHKPLVASYPGSSPHEANPLAYLFTAILRHGYVRKSLRNCILAPIPKTNKDTTIFLLYHLWATLKNGVMFPEHFPTYGLQFGFKGKSPQRCTETLKNTDISACFMFLLMHPKHLITRFFSKVIQGRLSCTCHQLDDLTLEQLSHFQRHSARWCPLSHPVHHLHWCWTICASWALDVSGNPTLQSIGLCWWCSHTIAPSPAPLRISTNITFSLTLLKPSSFVFHALCPPPVELISCSMVNNSSLLTHGTSYSEWHLGY